MILKAAFCILTVFAGSVSLFGQVQKTDSLAVRYYKTYEVDADKEEKNGSYEEVYKDKVITKGTYKNNKRNGAWKFIGMNDTVEQEGEYADGLKNGIWKSYYSNGSLSCVRLYPRGKKSGDF